MRKVDITVGYLISFVAKIHFLKCSQLTTNKETQHLIRPAPERNVKVLYEEMENRI
jgi:hypothetical protein